MSNRINHRHRRGSHWSKHETTMCLAFLRALGEWVTVHQDDPTAQVTLPTGVATAEELTNVLRALEKAREQTNNN